METDNYLDRIYRSLDHHNSAVAYLPATATEIPEGPNFFVSIKPVKVTITVWEHLLRRLDELSDQVQVVWIDRQNLQLTYAVKEKGGRNPINFEEDEILHKQANCLPCD